MAIPTFSKHIFQSAVIVHEIGVALIKRRHYNDAAITLRTSVEIMFKVLHPQAEDGAPSVDALVKQARQRLNAAPSVFYPRSRFQFEFLHSNNLAVRASDPNTIYLMQVSDLSKSRENDSMFYWAIMYYSCSISLYCHGIHLSRPKRMMLKSLKLLNMSHHILQRRSSLQLAEDAHFLYVMHFNVAVIQIRIKLYRALKMPQQVILAKRQLAYINCIMDDMQRLGHRWCGSSNNHAAAVA